MKSARIRAAIAAGAATAAVAASLTVLGGGSAQAQPFTYKSLNPVQQRHLSGLATSILNGDDDAGKARAAAPFAAGNAAEPYRPSGNGCSSRLADNVKVNQNCLNVSDSDLQGRGQAQNETWTAVDPNDPRHLIASYNDYRRGDGTCGVSYSLDGGRTWADSTTPNGFTRGGGFGGNAREYWQSGGDTSVAYDSKGNAYLSCQMFNRGGATSGNPDASSAFYIYRSTGTAGASWNFTGHPVAEIPDLPGTGGALLDKQLMAVDNNARSRFADRVYVSWTTFAADGTGYIYEAYSADYGQTFSAPVLVSRDSAACTNTFGLPTPQGKCNENQDSQPFVGADGMLYVVYNNFNNTVTGNDNRNQVMLARSTDGGATFSDPVKVGDYYDLPDCLTYQGADAGRACLPEKGTSTNSIFRAGNAPAAAADPRDPSRVVVTYGSYVNRNSNEANGCTPAGFSATTGINLYDGVKNGGCNNDIVMSVSTDGGRSFAGTNTDVRRLPSVGAGGQGRSDQFWQGAAFTPRGTLVVSYYDRQYGDDATTGYSDITVSAASGRDLTRFSDTRATSSSMPPPTQFSGTFYGDYAGLAVTNDTAYPVWSDTRTVDRFLCPGTGTPGNPPKVCTGSAPNAPVANDEEIFTNGVDIPGR
ncbi:sialidase family protein [Yinghuangia seranimata]|uniref:sialidase family protein n=1 Tax=Yinghuangia seranimata TaxID=408067 RepID=UPI00248C06E7|nr:sialidase family protein [Yinghuangia seranimata]MDI2130140.1 sialidase family protein [Yinghuangia seranimata]